MAQTMSSHHETQILPYTPQQLFELVADVACYPEFLPWCSAARVTERTGDRFLGELVIHYKGMSESYTSRVTLTPYTAIDVAMVKGPFEYLTNNWRFTAEGGGTRIDFALDFKFRSKLLEKLMGGFFTRATEKMMGAFKERAETLYGRKNNA
ncbi:MAG: type II toxin-antitoxin system RatA family toxin [Alphaproteobacteria bacterium]|nr:type II toxin-antitoxin system RatA family toxin [Alphaproteobacteria bacterium]